MHRPFTENVLLFGGEAELTGDAAAPRSTQANLACGELETALKDFDIALQHNTDNPEFPFYRGLVFEVMGNHEAARTWFNQVRPRAAPYG